MSNTEKREKGKKKKKKKKRKNPWDGREKIGVEFCCACSILNQYKSYEKYKRDFFFSFLSFW
jgi:hypothetical protein